MPCWFYLPLFHEGYYPLKMGSLLSANQYWRITSTCSRITAWQKPTRLNPINLGTQMLHISWSFKLVSTSFFCRSALRLLESQHLMMTGFLDADTGFWYVAYICSSRFRTLLFGLTKKHPFILRHTQLWTLYPNLEFIFNGSAHFLIVQFPLRAVAISICANPCACRVWFCYYFVLLWPMVW